MRGGLSEDNPGPYVSQKQCSKQVARFQGELNIVKKALVGDDMRGGLVKDMGQLTSDVKTVREDIASLKKRKAEEKELSLKWQLGIVTALIAAFSGIAAALISALL